MENVLRTPQTTVTATDTAPGAKEAQVSYHADTLANSAPLKGSPSMSRSSSKLPLIGLALAVLLGVGTGVGVAKLQGKAPASLTGGSGTPLQQVATGTVKNGDVFGLPDEKTFKDSAEGYLEAGGLDGEGSHKLVRAGGVSQTVYLTSSVTDLEKFVGMNVKVWGETFKGQKAGWLMDVGRIQVVNTQGQPPAEE